LFSLCEVFILRSMVDRLSMDHEFLIANRALRFAFCNFQEFFREALQTLFFFKEGRLKSRQSQTERR
jgi:hypothetical protein